MTLRVGVLGLGSVFFGGYRELLAQLQHTGQIEFAAAYDPLPEKRAALAEVVDVDVSAADADDLINREDLDIVVILTNMTEHGPLARRALSAGKHVLVEKPMATSLEEAQALLEAWRLSDRQLACAPHVILSPTYREIRRRTHDGIIGQPLLARARYGWSGPWWSKWYYEPGGGALFDLSMYNITSLCGLFGSVQRVTAFVGIAQAERIVEQERVQVQSDDNAHVLLDFGDSRFASVTTGFTMQRYRSPAIEIYGTEGVLQLLGDDWAPEGFEQWRNSHGAWEIFPETDPGWRWTEGLRHLVESIEAGKPTVTRPEHAYHALEVVLAAMQSAREGKVIEISSDFPSITYAGLSAPGREQDATRVHDARAAV